MLLLIVLAFGCAPKERVYVDRHTVLPTDLQKMTPELDKNPPILHSAEFEQPVPFAAVNTVGGEDSPFVPADRDEFYFFFTPDVRVPVERQILDSVTGIWVSRRVDGAWQGPERVWLQDPGKLSGDGCEFVSGDKMWFCTVREGYTGLHWATAEWDEELGAWKDWQVNDFPEEYEVGELHFADDDTVYFHSTRAGGKGDNDIWMMTRSGEAWGEPVNVAVVNSEVSEGWPYITPDGQELWFNRWYKGTPGTFRSRMVDGEWQEPELIVESFAGEPTLDGEGNLYFVHHYYDNGVMLEADIYVAYRK
ncbi:hypothetical protein KY362_07265 [Candidatus Woesearchaeota archaeon]|nr:hypothetical protein [Candidatus Woesearchaeota archaeon]